MVIILNGTSSSGKSSILEKICDFSDDLYSPFSSDKIVCGSLSHKIDFENSEDFKIIDASYSAFRKSLGVFASHIPYIILDDVIWKSESLHEIIESFKTVDCFFVHVTAPINIIEKREQARTDRKPGTARSQYDFISHLSYDFVVDSSQQTPSEAAQSILQNLKPGNAIKNLAQTMAL